MTGEPTLRLKKRWRDLEDNWQVEVARPSLSLLSCQLINLVLIFQTCKLEVKSAEEPICRAPLSVRSCRSFLRSQFDIFCHQVSASVHFVPSCSWRLKVPDLID